MSRITIIVASSGRRESGHRKPEAKNMFFDVVMKVLTNNSFQFNSILVFFCCAVLVHILYRQKTEKLSFFVGTGS